ncbi:unnamed protein product [Allacma fusca]|uniref:Uncharacterized protein n=1 Tax=Allacma fusca TaxID=39272 RepID=A0A8J2L2K0_9HEXA|nr:unnamed protein product [Allacma fusca]
MIFGLYLVEIHEDICSELCMKFYDEASIEFKLAAENDLLFKLQSEEDDEARTPYWFEKFLTISGDSPKTEPKNLKESGNLFFVNSKGSQKLNFSELSEKFKDLKSCFNKYSEIAGIYALMILVSCSAIIVDSVGGLAFKTGYTDERFRNVFGAVFLLLIVAHFGDFMSSKVCGLCVCMNEYLL